MRMKALLALLGAALALMLVVGCDDENTGVTTASLSGFVTNAESDTPQGDATVTLLRDGVAVASTQTNGNGIYLFSTVTPGSGYAVRVTSNTDPAEFPPYTTDTFTVIAGRQIRNITVGTEAELASLNGTVTNVETNLGQENATVTLRQNGDVVDIALTDAQGQFAFSNVQPGSNYTLLVTSNDLPPAFDAVTTPAFTLVAGTNTRNVDVGEAATGATVSGTIGTIESTATWTVSILKGTTVYDTVTAGPAVEPTFTLDNVPAGSGYVIKVVNNTTGIVTLFGPLTVPEAGKTGVIVYTRTVGQLSAEGVPASADVVALMAGGGQITVGANTSVLGNPTWLTNLTAGAATVVVTPSSGTPFTFTNVPVTTTQPVVIRYNSTF